jgi:hypothetical protein
MKTNTFKSRSCHTYDDRVPNPCVCHTYEKQGGGGYRHSAFSGFWRIRRIMRMIGGALQSFGAAAIYPRCRISSRNLVTESFGEEGLEDDPQAQ